MVASIASPNLINLAHIRPEIRDLYPQLVEWRRNIHQRPELAFNENLTASFISEKLKQWGIPHQTNIAKTGIVAIIDSGKEGNILGIRCDMDALPIQEENEISYRSRHDGKMHACGHDGHMAIALGTAYYLWHHRDSFKGQVKMIFQPAEEGPGGAKPMINEGVLKNPDLDGIIGLHIWNPLPLGTIGVRSGALMAATEIFKCTIFGKGGHGAMPDETTDAIVIGSQIVNALQTIVSRNIKPIDAAVVTVGSFHGGTTHNVIADTVEMTGTVRYFKPQLEGVIEKRIESIIAGICDAHGASYDFNYQKFYPPVINNDKMTELVRSVAMNVVETPAGIIPECQTMGGEDMSFFLREIPGCYFFVGGANSEKGLDFPHHHPRFNFDETALGIGMEMFIRCVEKFCN